MCVLRIVGHSLFVRLPHNSPMLHRRSGSEYEWGVWFAMTASTATGKSIQLTF